MANSSFAGQFFSGTSGCSGYSGSGGGGNGSSVTLTMTAGESIDTNNLVYVARSDSYGQTAGRVYNTNATYAYASFASWMLGFATASASAGNSITVLVDGIVTGLSGLTPGAVEYPSTTPGGLTETAPVNGVPIGFALTSTTLLVNRLASMLPGNYSLPGAVSTATYGYFAGGSTGNTAGATVATADRLTFSSSIMAASTASNLSAHRGGVSGVSDNANYGYFAGGSTSTMSAAVVTTDRITFSNSTTAANTTSNLSQARNYAAGVSDGTNYGYFGGGSTGGDYSGAVATTDQITFATSATAASTVSNLSMARWGPAGLADGAV